MGYLILLTLNGSALYAGYMVLEGRYRGQVPQSMRYSALRIVLLSYVMPWAWLRGPYSSLAKMLLGHVPGSGRRLGIVDIRAEGAAYRTPGYWQMMLILAVWVGGAVWQMARKLTMYLRCRRMLLTSAEECREGALERIVTRLKKELHWKGRLRIIKSQRGISMTIGFLRPVIFLQDYRTEKELEWILRHEMTHIARGDLLWKLAAEAVYCLHWFNPAARRAVEDLCQVCETSCDERVLKDRSPEERESYCRLVTESMGRKGTVVPLGSAFGSSQKNAEERIDLIMKKGKIERRKKLAAGSLFAAMVLASTLTAFAYPHVYQVEDAAAEAVENSLDGSIYWMAGDAEGSEGASTETVLYDEQFVDEAGGIYPADLNHVGKICLFGHEIVSGYYQTHVEDADGGCTVESYESTRCINCDAVWGGDLTSTHTYIKCPH